jgi:predicted transcriptional regulator
MTVPKGMAIVKNNNVLVVRRKFFAVCKNLGINAEEMKETIKIKYNVDSFNKLTAEELSNEIVAMESDVINRKENV